MKLRPLLFVDHAGALGGAERSLLLLLKHLDRSRWALHLACPPGRLAEAASELGVMVHLVALPKLRNSVEVMSRWRAGIGALHTLAKRVGVGVMIANTVRAALYVAPAARWSRCPFVWHMRDFWLSEAAPRGRGGDLLDRWLKQVVCASAAMVIANSRATAGHLPCREDRVRVVHNGIEVERFNPALYGGDFRQRYAIPPEAPLVGTIGRLRPWKGQDRFLRVLAHLRQTRPQLWGVVVGGRPFGGEDDYPQKLRRLAHELGVAEVVRFTGQIDDTRPALAAMDVFVHPGEPEPFGLVNVEAMAMAKPVVAFAHGALPEIVVEGETGVLVPPGDEVAMAKAIGSLLDDEVRRAAMGAAGRRRVERYFAIARTVEGVEDGLASVVRAYYSRS